MASSSGLGPGARSRPRPGPDPALWFLNNVARNSPVRISDFEIASLELQRLWAMSKNDRVKLRATFGWVSPEREGSRRYRRVHPTGHMWPGMLRGWGWRRPGLVPAPPSWFLNNVARNSPVRISDFEIASLELQRLWAMSKNDRVKLRATFGGPRKGEVHIQRGPRAGRARPRRASSPTMDL